MKRIAAPRVWDVMRKESKFIFKPIPGPHPIERSYPLAVIVRDILNLTDNSRETRYVIKKGKILVDGKARKELSFPVGLFDIVSVPDEGANFRVIPSNKGLRLIRITSDEAKLKLCRVNRKLIIKGNKIQLGTHDGRSFVDGLNDVSPGDSILIEIPSQKIVDKIKLEKGTLCIVISGERAGQVGKVIEIKKGKMAREKMVDILFSDGQKEVPARLVMPVGKDKPVLSLDEVRV